MMAGILRWLTQQLALRPRGSTAPMVQLNDTQLHAL